MFSWGILYGHLTVNTAKGVPDLERPEELEAQHRPWAHTEFNAMVDGARARGWKRILLALGLGRFAGWPTGDITDQPPSVWQRPRLIYVRRKTRKGKNIVNVLAPDPLLDLLDEVGVDRDAKTLLVNTSGQPYRRADSAR